MGSVTDGLRAAGPADAAAIARIVNQAYDVESFFVAGDRTTADAVRDLLRSSTFVVALDPHGDLNGAVHVAVDGMRATFGMLAVHVSARGTGLGSRLVAAAESYARAHGATVMEIHVVNLRTELLPFYERQGYDVTGTAPYDHRPVIRPCHFVVMEKALRPAPPSS